MTSPSRKKRPTTPLSSNRPTAAKLVAALCAATTLAAPWSAAAGEWRAAGKTSWRQSGAVAPAAAEQPVAGQVADSPRAVMVRRGDERVAQIPQTGTEFDPFDEPLTSGPLTDDDAAMPAAEPLRTPGSVRPPQVDRPQFDPFDEPEVVEPETTEPEVTEPEAAPVVDDEAVAETDTDEEAEEFEPETQTPGNIAPAVDNADAPFLADVEDKSAPAEEPAVEEQAEETFDIEQAFDAPRSVRPQPRQPEPVAAPSSADEELEQAEEAIDQEIQRRDIDRDRPGRVMPNPFRGEEQRDERPFGQDEDDRPRDDSEDVYDDPSDDEQYNDDPELDPLHQQSPSYDGGLRDGTIQSLTPEQEQARDLQLEQERIAVQEDCEDFIEAVRADDIKSVDLSIRMQGRAGEDYPFDCGFGQELYQPRTWPQVTYMWKAAGLCHKPLYFEQVQLERYGHSWPPVVQPLLSGAHFFASVPLLPYKMGLTTPNECIYTLGYYRPGSCAPYMIDAVPFTWRAAAFEAGAWTGGSFIFP